MVVAVVETEWNTVTALGGMQRWGLVVGQRWTAKIHRTMHNSLVKERGLLGLLICWHGAVSGPVLRLHSWPIRMTNQIAVIVCHGLDTNGLWSCRQVNGRKLDGMTLFVRPSYTHLSSGSSVRWLSIWRTNHAFLVASPRRPLHSIGRYA